MRAVSMCRYPARRAVSTAFFVVAPRPDCHTPSPTCGIAPPELSGRVAVDTLFIARGVGGARAKVHPRLTPEARFPRRFATGRPAPKSPSEGDTETEAAEQLDP